MLTSLTSTPVQETQVSYSCITASSFQELARQSPLIVIGQVTEIGEAINAGRDVNEARPATPYYDIEQIYKFQIERFLKGRGDPSDNATLNILVFEGWEEPMVPGTRYLLFLDLSSSFPPEKQYYVGAMHPWMFSLTNPDYVMTEDPCDWVDQNFPSQPLADILWQIENPDIPYVRPTATPFILTPNPMPDPGLYPPPYPYPNP
jgi:hypothetical protein